MHIPDNYLSPATCAVLAAAAAPVLVRSVSKVKLQLQENTELAPMLGVSASLSFLMMMFNVPIPGGTTAHAVGGTLLAILIGPYAASLSLTVALLLQAFLFGDGGILALGANIFNMACVMPFVGYWIYNFFRRRGHDSLGAIVGSYVGINVAAFLAAIELGIQPIIANHQGQPLYNPYGLTITIPAMMMAHLLIAGWVEAFFTYVIFRFVKSISPQELYTATNKNTQQFIRRIRYFLIFLVVISPLGLLAQGTAFGEWSTEELSQMLAADHISTSAPQGMVHGFNFSSIFSDYQIPHTTLSLGYILSAVTAVLIFYILSKVIMSINESRKTH